MALSNVSDIVMWCFKRDTSWRKLCGWCALRCLKRQHSPWGDVKHVHGMSGAVLIRWVSDSAECNLSRSQCAGPSPRTTSALAFLLRHSIYVQVQPARVLWKWRGRKRYLNFRRSNVDRTLESERLLSGRILEDMSAH